MKKKNPLDNNFIFIIALIIAFSVFTPLGILLLMYKCGLLFPKHTKTRNINSDSHRNIRFDKYKIMTEGRNAESIDYLASAVGVPYDTCIRDLQQMVAEGQFGASAYINYVDKTLVIIPREKARTAGYSGTDTRPKQKNRNDGTTDNARSAYDAAGRDGNVKAEKDAKNSDSALRKVLLIVGIVLVAVGAISISEPLEWLIYLGVDSYTISELVPGTFMIGGGIFSFLYRGFLKKRSNRFKLYEAAIFGRDFVPISELASKAGVSSRKAKKDLETMLEQGLLPPTAYIDQGDDMLVLRPGASPKVEDEPEPPKDDEDRYRAILKEIRALNDAIPDPEVSRRIDEMENLTAKIFKAVQEKPEKLPQIKSFMSYYLPTTLKLLRSYAEFERAGAEGENIRKAKTEIERILDTLVDGFHKQLDKLYEADAMDISSDIDVLENMLRRDGLTGDDSPFSGTGTAAKGK